MCDMHLVADVAILDVVPLVQYLGGAPMMPLADATAAGFMLNVTLHLSEIGRCTVWYCRLSLNGISIGSHLRILVVIRRPCVIAGKYHEERAYCKTPFNTAWYDAL